MAVPETSMVGVLGWTSTGDFSIHIIFSLSFSVNSEIRLCREWGYSTTWIGEFLETAHTVRNLTMSDAVWSGGPEL
jgi:hypothetical protein